MQALAILFTDDHGIIARANGAALTRFGACIGKPCAGVVAVRDAVGKPQCSETCARRLLEEPGSTHLSCGRVTASASEVYCTPMGRGVVVSVHPAPSQDGLREALSAREVQVVGEVAAGRSMKEVGARLGLAPTTVRTHLDRAKRKLDAATLPELIARAIRLGLHAG